MRAKRRRSYHRNLPHLHSDTKPMFVSFSTHARWALPESVRSTVLSCCLRFHGTKIHVYAVVVMPDHVHMVFRALVDADKSVISLPEVMSGIKGASAHEVNHCLDRRGSVWEEEFFDHILRSSESLNARIEYVRQNPVRAGLAAGPEEYPWLWTDRPYGRFM